MRILIVENQKCQKNQVSVGMATDNIHNGHTTRFVCNSNVQKQLVQEAFLLDKTQLVQSFQKANAVSNKVTNKTYAQIVVNNLHTEKGVQMHEQPLGVQHNREVSKHAPNWFNYNHRSHDGL